MSSHIPSRLRGEVIAKSGGRCAYCQSLDELMGDTFEVDHIIPQSAGGATSLDNLCLSCPTCNRHKAARLTAQDPVSGSEMPLFHPHQQTWGDHFAWSNDGAQVIGLTPVGRATRDALQMNRSAMVQLRRYWAALNLHPPG